MWRRLVYWQGQYGYPRLCITNYALQPSSTPGTLDNTLAGMSNAGIIQIAEGVVTAFTPTPAGGVYPSVAQAAQINCVDTSGFGFRLTLPAPALFYMESDAITLKTSSLAAIQTAALLDQVVSPQGNPLSSIISGFLARNANPGSTLT